MIKVTWVSRDRFPPEKKYTSVTLVYTVAIHFIADGVMCVCAMSEDCPRMFCITKIEDSFLSCRLDSFSIPLRLHFSQSEVSWSITKGLSGSSDQATQLDIRFKKIEGFQKLCRSL